MHCLILHPHTPHPLLGYPAGMMLMSIIQNILEHHSEHPWTSFPKPPFDTTSRSLTFPSSQSEDNDMTTWTNSKGKSSHALINNIFNVILFTFHWNIVKYCTFSRPGQIPSQPEVFLTTDCKSLLCGCQGRQLKQLDGTVRGFRLVRQEVVYRCRQLVFTSNHVQRNLALGLFCRNKANKDFLYNVPVTWDISMLYN